MVSWEEQPLPRSFDSVFYGAAGTPTGPFYAGGNRGLFMGGQTDFSNRTASIDYIAIPTTGNASDFGDLSVATAGMAAASNRSRGLSAGGNGGDGDQISYITFSTTGNSTDFGNLQEARNQPSGVSSKAGRGIFGGGYSTPDDARSDMIDYVAIATTGNATDFGNLLAATEYASGCNDPTRGVFGLGVAGGSGGNVIQYITMGTTGNASDFGDFVGTTLFQSACASFEGRGVFSGGKGSGELNRIQYITIASTGNATDFGDLTANSEGSGSASNGTRATIAGGVDRNTIAYIAIGTTGNATDFGDLSQVRHLVAGNSGA